MATTKKVVKKEKAVTPDVSKEPTVITTSESITIREQGFEIDFTPAPELEETKKIEEVLKLAPPEPEPIVQQPVAQKEPEYNNTGTISRDTWTDEVEKTLEDKILDFVESRTTPEVRLNEFLKSLYGVPQGGKQKHEHITELRYLRSVLAGLDGKLSFTSRQFLTLGNTRYEGVEMKAKKITLNDINIVVKK